MCGLYFVVAFAPKPEMWATAGDLGKEPVVAQTPKRPPGWRPLCLVGILELLLIETVGCEAELQHRNARGIAWSRPGQRQGQP